MQEMWEEANGVSPCLTRKEEASGKILFMMLMETSS